MFVNSHPTLRSVTSFLLPKPEKGQIKNILSGENLRCYHPKKAKPLTNHYWKISMKTKIKIGFI
jgi:hypothetical protein